MALSDRTGRRVDLDVVNKLESVYVLRPGVTGLDMPPVALSSDALPDDDGSLLRSLRFVERDIFLPIWISAVSHEQLRTRTQALLALLNPRKSSDPYDERNIVDVTVGQPNGSRRLISGYYVGGAEGSYGPNEYGVEWRVIGATIRCLDPFWHATDPLSLPFVTTPAANPFLSTTVPFFPVRLGTSQVLGSVTIDNPGDVDAYIVWTVVGPGASFTATNATTGRTLTFGADLTGKTITIDTRRQVQTVVDQTEANLFGDLTGDLWPLVPGANAVTLAVSGATTETLVTATVHSRFLSP